MARIRTVKPEFWQDEKLAPLAPTHRLVFLGLIGMADDAGRVLDSVKMIDAFVFPCTEDTSRESLDVLANASRIVRGQTASGQKVIQIVNWSRHQKVDHPNLKACLPQLVAVEEVEGVSRGVRDPLATLPTTYDLRPVPTTDDQPPTLPHRLEQELRDGLADFPEAATTFGLLLDKARTPAIRFSVVADLRKYGPGGAQEVGAWADVADGLSEAVKNSDRAFPPSHYLAACIRTAKAKRLEREAAAQVQEFIRTTPGAA